MKSKKSSAASRTSGFHFNNLFDATLQTSPDTEIPRLPSYQEGPQTIELTPALSANEPAWQSMIIESCPLPDDRQDEVCMKACRITLHQAFEPTDLEFVKEYMVYVQGRQCVVYTQNILFDFANLENPVYRFDNEKIVNIREIQYLRKLIRKSTPRELDF